LTISRENVILFPMTTKKIQNSLEEIRHSFAHVMAHAVVDLFPEAKLGIGPAIENGFYYDFF
jgi:threonyl-tRNA synthetase